MPTINERALVAAALDAAQGTLRELAADKSPKVRAAVAENPSTPADVLRVLVADAHWNVRFSVAENPGPAARDIALDAADADVRGRAAQREDLDAAGIERLLGDEVHAVRERLAEVTDDEVVAAALARDPHPAVRATVVVCSNALSEADVEMLAKDSIAQVRSAVAGSRRVSPETLTLMAGDRSAQVRWSVLVSNPERLDLVRMIADDRDEMNAHQARAQLENPRPFTAFLGDIDLVV